MAGLAVVTGVNGAQQAAVAQAFADSGWTVRGTARAPDGKAGFEVRPADLHDASALRAAFDGADVVAFTLPQIHTPGAMTAMTEAVAEAAAAAGVARLIVNLGGTMHEDGDDSFSMDLKAARAAALASAAPATVLQPTVFMDNLLAPWIAPAIVGEGVLAYPAPVAARISWLSHRSLGAMVVATAAQPDLAGRELRIGGPEALTGDELAAILAAHLRRPVAYQRLPLAHFAAGIDQAFGPPAGERLASIYARLDVEPDAMAVAADGELGVRAETFAAFVERSFPRPQSLEPK